MCNFNCLNAMKSTFFDQNLTAFRNRFLRETPNASWTRIFSRSALCNLFFMFSHLTSFQFWSILAQATALQSVFIRTVDCQQRKWTITNLFSFLCQMRQHLNKYQIKKQRNKQIDTQLRLDLYTFWSFAYGHIGKILTIGNIQNIGKIVKQGI